MSTFIFESRMHGFQITGKVGQAMEYNETVNPVFFPRKMYTDGTIESPWTPRKRKNRPACLVTPATQDEFNRMVSQWLYDFQGLCLG